jgi:hypothetical protein
VVESLEVTEGRLDHAEQPLPVGLHETLRVPSIKRIKPRVDLRPRPLAHWQHIDSIKSASHPQEREQLKDAP